MKRILLLTCLFIVLGGQAACAWGFLAHRVIHQLAIYSLPKPMRAFYFAHRDYLVDQSVRPDKRRSQDSLEAPRHYIDVDYYGDSAAWTMPHAWEVAVQKYSADTLVKYGHLPWQIDRVRRRLTEAMRRGDCDSILFYSADLGHYLADAHVPFHTTLNYDGQLTGQRGIHSFWESKLPGLFIGTYDLRQAPSRYLRDPQQATWEAIQGSFVLIKPALDLERATSQQVSPAAKYTTTQFGARTFRNYSDEFARAYHPGQGDVVAKRMRDAAQSVASFWRTCWQDAGRPDLGALQPGPLSAAEAKQLRRERKAWQRNQLEAQGLLKTDVTGE
jgi:hypothetical protein